MDRKNSDEVLSDDTLDHGLETATDNDPSEEEQPASTEEAPTWTDVKQIQEELQLAKERYLRQAAEFQNYRRRTEQERITLVQTGKIQVLSQILEIVDDLERSLDAARGLEGSELDSASGFVSLKEGVEMVSKKFKDQLSRLGVEPIDAIGHPFNEEEHEAMMQQPATKEAAPGTVLEELQKGYRMGDRVLRHSRVIVAA